MQQRLWGLVCAPKSTDCPLYLPLPLRQLSDLAPHKCLQGYAVESECAASVEKESISFFRVANNNKIARLKGSLNQ